DLRPVGTEGDKCKVDPPERKVRMFVLGFFDDGIARRTECVDETSNPAIGTGRYGHALEVELEVIRECASKTRCVRVRSHHFRFAHCESAREQGSEISVHELVVREIDVPVLRNPHERRQLESGSAKVSTPIERTHHFATRVRPATRSTTLS